MTQRRILLLSILLCLLAAGPTAAQTETETKTVDDLSKAASALGLQMLRPHTAVEPHRPYSMIVRQPRKLIPLGVDDVGPGDRVICRLLDGNRIVLYTSYGDRSAPIQLAADGSVEKVQKVQDMEMNKHYSAQQRDRRAPPNQNRGPAAGAQQGMSGGLSGGAGAAGGAGMIR